MARDRELKVRIKAEGQSQVKQAVNGTVATARRAGAAQRTEAQKTAAAQAKAAHEGARAAKRSADETVKETQRAERRRRAEFERTAREQERQERRAAARSRNAGRGGGGGGAPRGRGGGDDFFGRAAEGFGSWAGGLVGLGAITATLQGILSRMEERSAAVGAAAGRQDLGQRTVGAQQIELGLARLGGEVFKGMDARQRAAELARVRDEIVAIAEATGRQPGDLFTALQTFQTEFSAFDFGRQNLRAIADEATRTGTEVEQLARFAGLVRQQFGELDVNRIFDITAQAGMQGSLTPEQLSGEFAQQLGLFRSFVDRGRTQDPETLLRQFVAMANVIRSSGAGAAESATLAQNLMASLSDQDVQDRIAMATGGRVAGRRRVNGQMQDVIRGGVQLRDFRDASGALDLAGYVEALAARDGFGSLEDLRATIGDQQASIALNTLIARRRDEVAGVADNADLRELMNVDAAAGAATRTENLSDVMRTDAMRAQQDAARTAIDGVRSSGRSRQAVLSNAIRTDAESQGVLGEVIANLPGFAEGLAALTTNDNAATDFLLNAMGRGDVVASRRAAAAAEQTVGGGGAKVVGGGGAAKGDIRDAMREALDARPVRVEVVNPAAAPTSPGAANGDARRSASPRERTGR